MPFISVKFSNPVRVIEKPFEQRPVSRVSLQNEQLRTILVDKDAADVTPLTLTRRQRVALAVNTRADVHQVLEMDEADITADFLAANGVNWLNLKMANISVNALTRMGYTLARLVGCGMDAIELVRCPRLTRDLTHVFGATAVRRAVISSPGDAVVVAGTETARVLDVSQNTLLETCNPGFVSEALTIMSQYQHASPLQGVKCETLVNAGIRKEHLLRLGFNAAYLANNLVGSNEEVARLVPSLL